MYELRTSCNGISQISGTFDNLSDAKLTAGLAMHMFVKKFSVMEEFDREEGENWCSAKGRTSGFVMKVEVVKVGA